MAGFDRRGFALVLGGGALWLGCRPWMRPDAPSEITAYHRDTIAALAETAVPGGDGTPGAHECGAAAVICDPAYGVHPYVTQLVADLDDWCMVAHGGRFTELSAEERELALEERLGMHGWVLQSLYKPAYEGAIALAKLAFFGGLANHLGTNAIGFPGASRGYAPDSAAGAYASCEAPRTLGAGVRSAIAVEGHGALAMLRVSAYAIADEGAELAVAFRARTPDGRLAPLGTARASASGDLILDDVDVPLLGGPAAGLYLLEAAGVVGSGHLVGWSLRLFTDLDRRA